MDRRRLIHILVSLALMLGVNLYVHDGSLDGYFFVLAVVPLACIWFPEALGSYTGPAYGSGVWISRRTPAGFVRFAGYLLLIAPLLWSFAIAPAH